MRQEDYSQTSFCFFEKASFEVKASGLQLSFNIFHNFAYNKYKLYTTLD